MTRRARYGTKKRTAQVFSLLIVLIGLPSCQSTTQSGAPALGYAFESDEAAHRFYQAILDRTELPLSTKTKYVDTPILVIETVNQVSGAQLAREAAQEADTDGDLIISLAEAKAFAE